MDTVNKTPGEENKKNKKPLLLILLACVLCIVATIGGILAFLTAHDQVTNTFTVGNVDIEVDEPNYPGNDSDEVKGMLPEDEVTKDPLVINTGNNDAVIFMAITMPYDEGAVFEWKTGDGEWTAGEAAEAGWELIGSKTLNDGAEIMYVYGYKSVVASGDSTTSVFDTVRIANVSSATFEKLDGGADIVIDGLAIQADNIVGEGVDTSNMDLAELTRIYNVMLDDETSNVGGNIDFSIE